MMEQQQWAVGIQEYRLKYVAAIQKQYMFIVQIIVLTLRLPKLAK